MAEPKTKKTRESVAKFIASIEDEVERICDLGCTRVNEIIATTASGKSVPELAGLNAGDSERVLERLKSIMAIYEARED